jgi:hypothetical protein
LERRRRRVRILAIHWFLSPHLESTAALSDVFRDRAMIGALLHHDGSARNNHRTEVTEVTEGEVTEEEGVME